MERWCTRLHTRAGPSREHTSARRLSRCSRLNTMITSTQEDEVEREKWISSLGIMLGVGPARKLNYGGSRVAVSVCLWVVPEYPPHHVVFLTNYPRRLACSARHSRSNCTASRSKKSAAWVFMASTRTSLRT